MHLTRSTWLVVAVGAAVLLGCGEGHVIFNVDVLSFLNTADDTVHYPSPIPPGTTIESPPISFRLPPGLGSKATVQSLSVTTADSVHNASGSGQVKFEILFGADSSTLYTTAKAYAKDSVVVSGVKDTVLAPDSVPIIGDTLFTNDHLFMGVRLTTGSGVTGRLRLSVLQLRIVLQDHLLQ